VFQQLDLSRDCGLRNVQALRRAAEAALLKDHQKQAEFFRARPNGDAKSASPQSPIGIICNRCSSCRVGHMNNHDTIDSQQLLDRLNWRYATKQFDPNRKISAHDWASLEDALLLTPSSGGLQPWKFIVVTDPAMRAKLLPASYGQPQITDASHLVVFAAKKNFNEADVDAFINRTAATRGVSVESLAPFRGMLVGGIVQSMDEKSRDAWARNQAYIALGNLLTSAALLGIDACPMEGFDRAQYDEILGLNAQGYASAVIATVGYRAATDKNANAPKVRFPREQVFAHI
jgi:nitroreductase